MHKLYEARWQKNWGNPLMLNEWVIAHSSLISFSHWGLYSQQRGSGMTHNKAHNALVVHLPHPDGHPGHPPMAPIYGLSLIAGKPIVRLILNWSQLGPHPFINFTLLYRRLAYNVGMRGIFQDGSWFGNFQTLISLLSYFLRLYNWLSWFLLHWAMLLVPSECRL